jgi:hypothetical protein
VIHIEDQIIIPKPLVAYMNTKDLKKDDWQPDSLSTNAANNNHHTLRQEQSQRRHNETGRSCHHYYRHKMRSAEVLYWLVQEGAKL